MELPVELVESVFHFLHALKLKQVHEQLLQRVQHTDYHYSWTELRRFENTWQRIWNSYGGESSGSVRWGKQVWNTSAFSTDMSSIYIRSLDRYMYYKNSKHLYAVTLPLQYHQKEVATQPFLFNKVA